MFGLKLPKRIRAATCGMQRKSERIHRTRRNIPIISECVERVTVTYEIPENHYQSDRHILAISCTFFILKNTCPSLPLFPFLVFLHLALHVFVGSGPLQNRTIISSGVLDETSARPNIRVVALVPVDASQKSADASS